MLLPYKIISPSLKGLVSLGTRPEFGVFGCRFSVLLPEVRKNSKFVIFEGKY